MLTNQDATASNPSIAVSPAPTFTPGPWYWWELLSDPRPRTIHLGPATGECVLEVTKMRGVPGDAALIAAAPDLLLALERLLYLAKLNQFDTDEGSAVDQAVNALIKAGVRL